MVALLPFILVTASAQSASSWYLEHRTETRTGFRQTGDNTYVQEKITKETYWTCYPTSHTTTLEARVVFDGAEDILQPDPENQARIFSKDPYACFLLLDDIFFGKDHELQLDTGLQYRNSSLIVRGIFTDGEQKEYTPLATFYTCGAHALSRPPYTSCPSSPVRQSRVPNSPPALRSPTYTKGNSDIDYLTFHNVGPETKAYVALPGTESDDYVVYTSQRTFELRKSGCGNGDCMYLVPDLFQDPKFFFYTLENKFEGKHYSYTSLTTPPAPAAAEVLEEEEPLNTLFDLSPSPF